MENEDLWHELDNIADSVKARFDVSSSPIFDKPVQFIKPYKKIAVGTKALVLNKQGEYFALTVKGNYVEGIHKSYLKMVK